MWMALTRTQRGGHRREGKSYVEPESKSFFFFDKKHPFMKLSFSFYHIALRSAIFFPQHKKYKSGSPWNPNPQLVGDPDPRPT